MPRMRVSLWLIAAALVTTLAQGATHDPLPSWQDGPSKQAITRFVADVTDPAGHRYVAPGERIAAFDNDGALWSEQPMYFQLAFALDRVRALAPTHPEWRTTQPFKGVLEGDLKSVAATGEHGLLQLVTATHTGNTPEEFQALVRQWLATARHPRFDRPYTDLVYQPMVELLAYLRANGFKTFIVSGGGVEFVRSFAQEKYGIPPEQVVGSSVKTTYEVRNGRPTLVRLPEIDFINDGKGKPVGINQYIGRRPILAFGNSDGDFEMLEWTTAGEGPRLGLILHHDDAVREYAYDRDSQVGRLSRALDEAAKRGWVVVSMQKDWETVHAPPKP
jgi:phosphoserine phosphatase